MRLALGRSITIVSQIIIVTDTVVERLQTYLCALNACNMYTVQITHNLNGPRMSHACDTCGVNHTRVGSLGSTCMYKHRQFLHKCVHVHTIFTLVCVFTRLHACMPNVASMLASYLPTSLSYNATVLVTLFFPYRALAAHQ